MQGSRCLWEGTHAVCQSVVHRAESDWERSAGVVSCYKPRHHPKGRREPLVMWQRRERLCFGKFALAAAWSMDRKGWLRLRD